MPDILNKNLILPTDNKGDGLPRQILLYLIIINLLAIFFYGALFIITDRLDSQKDSLTKEVALLSANMPLLGQKDILTFGSEVSNAHDLLANHIYPIKFLLKLANFSHPRMSLSEVQIRLDSSEKSTLQFKAADYRTIAETIKAFASADILSDINVTEIIQNQVDNSYSAKLSGQLNTKALQ